MEQDKATFKGKSQWAAEKEIIHSSVPMYLILFLVKCTPRFIISFIIRFVSVIYYLFSKRARQETLRYQNQLINYTGKTLMQKPNPYKQIVSFSATVVEKVECWVNKQSRNKIYFQNDDINELIQTVNEKRGAFIFISHLGNSEFLRHLSTINNISVDHQIPMAVLMDLNSTSNFTQALKRFNSDFVNNIINVSDISPATMIHLQDVIEQGGIVITAGDRIARTVNNRYIYKDFLGKQAPWSYGVFLMALLLKAPVFYMFGIRKKYSAVYSDYDIFVTKSKVELECPRNAREDRIKQLCGEFVELLEKKCIENPFQWYNFYDFWKIPESQD